jgi:hypothetical protein
VLPVASKTTLNAKNLEALGAARLAELLIELATGNATAKRRLRLELAGAESPRKVAHEVRKRLATIARSRSHVEWDGVKALAADLEMQRRAIADLVAKDDPKEALSLMWRLLDLADSIYQRCDDSNGAVGDVLHLACRDLGPLAEAARPEPITLAGEVFRAIQANHYGQFDDLIEVLAGALGPRGLTALKADVQALARTPVRKPPEAERKVVGWSSSGKIHADEIEAVHRTQVVSLALQAIADAEGDVDAYIAQHGEKARTVPRVAIEIARPPHGGGTGRGGARGARQGRARPARLGRLRVGRGEARRPRGPGP